MCILGEVLSSFIVCFTVFHIDDTKMMACIQVHICVWMIYKCIKKIKIQEMTYTANVTCKHQRVTQSWIPCWSKVLGLLPIWTCELQSWRPRNKTPLKIITMMTELWNKDILVKVSLILQCIVDRKSNCPLYRKYWI